ncbi:hypothetical protein [Streptococcus pneumoniae]|nr:hypothetical protein [Streptococcus pneumoniae]
MVYSIKIKEQTRKLDADSSKHCFEVVDEADAKSTTILRQDDADVV